MKDNEQKQRADNVVTNKGRNLQNDHKTRLEIQQRKRKIEEQQIQDRMNSGKRKRKERLDEQSKYGEEEKRMKASGNKGSKKEMAYRRKMKRLWAILGGEIAILFLLIIGYVLFYANDKFNEINFNDIDESELGINQELSGMSEEYTTIALFGLDSRDVSSDTGNRSDTIIIASINNETKEIKLVSVYRDCYMELENPNGTYSDSYTKITHAYAYGGPKATIATMNKNLDLQITDYVTVNFASLTDVVNDLGGITVNVDEAERQSVNIYLPETAQIAGMSYNNLYETGDVTLDGLQAVTYCRIRDVGNGDIDRAGRQREVLSAILDKAKKSDLKTLNTILDDVLPEVSTSLSKKEILALMSGVFDYELTENEGFPFIYHAGYAYDETLGKDLSMDIPANLENNVVLLHEFLYDATNESVGGSEDTESGLEDSSENDALSNSGGTNDKDVYTPSGEVVRISNEIQNNTYVYPPEDSEFRGGI